MNKKRSLIIEMFKNWYFIDSILLNDHAKKAITDKKDYKEYLSLKSALLSNLNEFYNYIDYKPDHKDNPSTYKNIQESATIKAKNSKKLTARMLEQTDIMKSVKTIIKENFNKNPNQNLKDLSDKVITERFLKMCLDNELIGIPLLRSSNSDKTSDFKSEILEQAYIAIRSDMIKIAAKHNQSLHLLNEVGVGAIVGALFVTVLGFKLLGATGRSIENFLNSCTQRCGMLKFGTSSKRACILKCKIQTQQKIISHLRQSAAQTNNVQARNKFAADVKRAQLRMTQYQRQLAKISATRHGAEDSDPSKMARVV